VVRRVKHGRYGIAAAPVAGLLAKITASGSAIVMRYPATGLPVWRRRLNPPWFPAEAERIFIFMALPVW